MLRMFRRLLSVSESGHAGLETHVREFCPADTRIGLEWCFYIGADRDLSANEQVALEWLLRETFDPDGLSGQTFLAEMATVIELGPRLNFETAWSTTAVSIAKAAGIDGLTRIERSLRIGLDAKLPAGDIWLLAQPLHDRMTQTIYDRPLDSFETGLVLEPVSTIPVLSGGRDALKAINAELGLAMDEQDLERFYSLFVEQLQRDPTDVELFQLGQGNSEHSRHGFFKGRLFIDGVDTGTNLMEVVKQPWRANPGNSLIAFKDDSSAINGRLVVVFAPNDPQQSGPMLVDTRQYDPTLTAETHNFPVMVEPYQGAMTGGGGRIRDNQCVGRGGLVVASGAAYCVATLSHPDLELPWQPDRKHPDDAASPIDILIKASNGASDYGNCFGEPIIYGFVRMFGQDTPEGYRAWFKPIMYTVGAGQIDHEHINKGQPREGQLLVQLGGSAYRIGMGGGAASSMMGGENTADLDFNAVQRGNPEMEQRMNRVLRACVEMSSDNPIISAHDLGAGGDSNALPEIAYPAGAVIYLRDIPVGDASLSVLEIWGNESQERDVVLTDLAGAEILKRLCSRENVPYAEVGEVRSDGRLLLWDERTKSAPVDLPLEPILGESQPKEVRLESVAVKTEPLDIQPATLTEALHKVLRLPSVGSKSYLTRKVDRSVTGLIAQQQCVGPNHLPLSDYAVIAQSLFGNSGVALSLGEQPIIGLVNPAAQGRMSVAEALLNLSGAKITQLVDIKCEGNWMWAAKLPGEGVRLYEAACAMRDLMLALGIAIDGGKDSLSMAVKDAIAGAVKAPGQLVIAPYAPMDDVSRKVTPDFKQPGDSLVLVDLSAGRARLGGSALAQAYGQLGDEVPDVEDPQQLAAAFAAIQELVARRLVVASHDRSDGGLIVTLMEMGFGGNLGFTADLGDRHSSLEALFNEELGVVMECAPGRQDEVLRTLERHGVTARIIGLVGPAEQDKFTVFHDSKTVLSGSLTEMRAAWDHTSSQLELLQTAPECVRAEMATVRLVDAPAWKLTYEPTPTSPALLHLIDKPKVAVVREQGTNGDRELAAAFHVAGFEVWDVTMSDLLAGTVSLEQFRGLAFPGGFSFADVLDSAKGWAGKIRFHPELAAQFDAFYQRTNTFSLGICNGCQLMALLGWVSPAKQAEPHRARFIRNRSGRFESRFVNARILESPAIMLQGMAGSTLGVWVAHGEGQAHNVLQLPPELAPIRYADPWGVVTESYPFNPNGSPNGIAGICSNDGRHLAMMPHPERLAHQLWQWPWLPSSWQQLEASPWLRLFQNAFDWCAQTS